MCMTICISMSEKVSMQTRNICRRGSKEYKVQRCAVHWAYIYLFCRYSGYVLSSIFYKRTSPHHDVGARRSRMPARRACLPACRDDVVVVVVDDDPCHCCVKEKAAAAAAEDRRPARRRARRGARRLVHARTQRRDGFFADDVVVNLVGVGVLSILAFCTSSFYLFVAYMAYIA